jgi:hypothetical protein
MLFGGFAGLFILWNDSNAAIRNAMDTLRDDKTKEDSKDKKSDE